ncbi:hypothetical protein GCM10027026_27840 [Myroides odoratimimus subsp. xuanwuensis]
MLAGVLAVVTGPNPPAAAAANDQTLSGTTSSMWQTNQPVDAIAAANGVVYAGGRFTQVRPPGAANGAASSVSRTYLAAFNASTGALITTFNFALNGRVYDLEVSPDNQTLYVSGAFSTVNGSARGRVAAINLANNTLNAFNPNANRLVTALAATSSRVYLSGDFTTVRGAARDKIASVYAPTASDGASGALDTGFEASLVAPEPSLFTENPSARALTMVVTSDRSRLLIGGGFDEVNGTMTGGVASLNPATGAVQDWAANSAQSINLNCSGRTRAIVVDGSNAYVTAEGDPPGCYEGTYAANLTTGQLIWNSSCLGASQGIVVMKGVLYKGSHQHDCAFTPGDARGGFVGGLSRSSFVHYYLVAQSTSDGSFAHWTPATNASGTGGVGPHVMATDGNQIFVGGDFTRINGAAQQGLARFSPGGSGATPEVPGRSYNADPFSGATPTLAINGAITVQPTAANTLTIEVPTVEDVDSGTLTYRVYRNNGAMPVFTQTAESFPWSRPVLRFDDVGLTPGSTHSYRVTASDGVNTSARSTAVSGTVSSSAPPPYAVRMSGLDPRAWWRLDDAGTTAVDSSGHGVTGTRIGGVGVDPSGAVTGSTAARLDGSTGYLTSDGQISAPNAFSQSAWFKTTSIRGGNILSQSDTRTGPGGIHDRIITMDNNGALVFAVKGVGRGGPFGSPSISLRNQGPIWNDGRWHHVVGTYDGNGLLTLYVDGQRQMSVTGSVDNPDLRPVGLPTSYLRAGYADHTNIQLVFGINFYRQKWPASDFFDGSLDEPAAWDRALTPAEVQGLFASGLGERPANAEPQASFSVTANGGAGVSVDASGSSDDGSIVAYSWNWGDGTPSGSGVSASHVYATSGTKTITLTVTDDEGATAQATRDVTVTAGQSETSTVIASGSFWSWKYDGSAPGSGWNGLSGNTSQWSVGNAILGFPASGVTTNVDTFATTSARPLAAYFVKRFAVSDANKVVGLALDGLANDGVVVYVNGVEVTRKNMPSGTITATTYASSARNATTAAGDPFVVQVPTNLLVTGQNVVAAETHLNYRATRDMGFDMRADLTTSP